MQRRLVPVLTALLTALTLVLTAMPASATVPVPTKPRSYHGPIETFAPYHAQTRCAPYTRPGTKKLGDLLVRTYPGTTYGTVRPCGKIGSLTTSSSEHYDGRAIDWMVSTRNPAQKAEGDALVAWLLGTDDYGHTRAMFRRLGIMYIIWNNQMWGTWDQQWEPYEDCAAHPSEAYDNQCHRTHVHISLSWAGAMAQTSFWSGNVVTFDS